jgi:hypothetical protein
MRVPSKPTIRTIPVTGWPTETEAVQNWSARGW